MPVLKSSFSSFLSNGHLQTILPNLYRKIDFMYPSMEEIETPDGDFLELDWYLHPDESSNKIAILSHGLEGNSRRRYMRGMAKYLYLNGYNVLAWNYRSCGTKMNRALRFYHSGETEDLSTIVNRVDKLNYIKSIYLIGFSMGGNISFKYLGEQAEFVNSKIRAAVGFSVPVDLVGSSKVLSKWWNRFYMRRFMKSLRRKISIKARIYPDHLNLNDFDEIYSFKGFDNKYTAPLHGFKDAYDYWQKSSSLPYLPNIRIPILIVNALNDSFLSSTCYPYDLAENSGLIHLETPLTGGHVGFFSLKEIYWTEERALDFLKNY